MSENAVTTRFKKQDDDPDAFMMKAKESLEKQREEVLAKRATFDEEIATIEGKLERIEAYFNPQKAAPPAPAPKQKRTGTGTRGPRQTGVREEVLAKIAANPEGITRKDLLIAMNATEPSHAQRISNYVAALKTDKKITAENGHYKAL